MRANPGLTYIVISTLGSFALSCASATGVPYLEHYGLNKLQYSRMNEICHFAMFITCIPAGVLADLFGRRVICLVSNIFLALGGITYALSRTMLGFGLAETLFGVGFALGSGSFQAWMIDHSVHAGNDCGHVLETTSMYCAGARIIGTIFGAYLATLWLPLPWITLSVTILWCTLCMQHWMDEGRRYVAPHRSPVEATAKARAILSEGIAYVRTHPDIRFLFLAGGLQLITCKGSDMQWADFFGAFGAGQILLGFVNAALQAVSGLGSLFSRHTKDWIREKPYLSLIQVLSGVGLVCSGFWSTSAFLGGCSFLMFQSLRGWWSTAANVFLNRHAPAHIRATILSLYTMSSVFVSMVGLEVGGQVAQSFGISTAWIVGGVVYILGSFFLLRF